MLLFSAASLSIATTSSSQPRLTVLSGDPLQLPPVVVSPTSPAQGHGLARPLFERLAAAGYPVTLLDTQYRCHCCLLLYLVIVYYIMVITIMNVIVYCYCYPPTKPVVLYDYMQCTFHHAKRLHCMTKSITHCGTMQVPPGDCPRGQRLLLRGALEARLLTRATRPTAAGPAAAAVARRHGPGAGHCRARAREPLQPPGGHSDCPAAEGGRTGGWCCPRSLRRDCVLPAPGIVCAADTGGGGRGERPSSSCADRNRRFVPGIQLCCTGYCSRYIACSLYCLPSICCLLLCQPQTLCDSSGPGT